MSRPVELGPAMSWSVVEDGTGVEVALARCDRAGGFVMLVLPDRLPVRLDAVSARAVWMMLGEAAYAGLDPDGPVLRLESHRG